MLGDRGDDVVAFLAVHLRHALDGEVIAFGGARSKDDFLGGGADQFGHALTRLLHPFFRLPAKAVIAAGGIAELIREVRHHLFQHARVDRRGGVVVHVDRQLHAGGVAIAVRAISRSDVGAHSTAPQIRGRSLR